MTTRVVGSLESLIERRNGVIIGSMWPELTNYYTRKEIDDLLQLPGANMTILQVVEHQLTTEVSGTTLIPIDTTIPQITEGFEILTTTITPSTPLSHLLVFAYTRVTTAGGGSFVTVALFEAGDSNAIRAGTVSVATAFNPYLATLFFHRLASVTTALTFSIRIGRSATAAAYANYNASLGGAAMTSLTVLEVQ